MANTLFLRLEGPLQSWGERAHWSVRDTAPEPTKSGIVGLLGCALGLADDESLQALSAQLRMGVRCDRPGVVLRDYHTVVGGVIDKEKGSIKVSNNTKGPETVVSVRYYLADASFLAALAGPGDLMDRLAAALRSPHWPIYLGRRCCPPSVPVFAGLGDHESLEAALAPAGGPPVRAVLECGPAEGVMRRQEMVSRSRRAYGPRFTRDVLLACPGPAAHQEALP